MEKRGETIELVFHVEPIAKQRARHSPRNNRHYTPKKTRDFESELYFLGRQQYKGKLITAPIILTAEIYKTRPKSVPRGKILCDKKPDLSNYLKSIEDGLEGVIWKNDSQIVQYRDCFKKYADKPLIRLLIQMLR